MCMPHVLLALASRCGGQVNAASVAFGIHTHTHSRTSCRFRHEVCTAKTRVYYGIGKDTADKCLGRAALERVPAMHDTVTQLASIATKSAAS